MGECDASGEKAAHPIQQLPQPQPVQSAKDEGRSPRAGSLAGEMLTAGKKPQGKEDGKEGVDEARFTAGIVRFYEALLREPIPEKMLRLIDEIARRERES